MKISFLTTTLSRSNGGVSEAARRLAQELHRQQPGCVEVLGTQDAHFAEEEQSWRPLHPLAFHPWFPKSYGYTPRLDEALNAGQPDLCHVHGLWAYPTLAARRWSRKGANRPYIVTIHGMLDSWALRNSRWKKEWVGALVERTNLKEAACLHAITQAEVESIRAYGLSNPVCLIPNGVDLPGEDAPKIVAPWSNSIPPHKKVLLYLGRIHPKKGLLPLIEGWKLLTRTSPPVESDWSLVIVGWSQGGHEDELQRKVREHGLEKSIYFAGAQYGSAKAAAYLNASAFVLPSYSEGMPLVVLEAWAHGLPVLMTGACNLPQGFSAGAALPVEPAPESLAVGMGKLIRLPDGDRKGMGARGRELVKNEFSWQFAATELFRVYRWLLGDERAPDSVIRNGETTIARRAANPPVGRPSSPP